MRIWFVTTVVKLVTEFDSTSMKKKVKNWISFVKVNFKVGRNKSEKFKVDYKCIYTYCATYRKALCDNELKYEWGNLARSGFEAGM